MLVLQVDLHYPIFQMAIIKIIDNLLWIVDLYIVSICISKIFILQHSTCTYHSNMCTNLDIHMYKKVKHLFLKLEWRPYLISNLQNPMGGMLNYSGIQINQFPQLEGSLRWLVKIYILHACATALAMHKLSCMYMYLGKKLKSVKELFNFNYPSLEILLFLVFNS